MTRPEKVKEAQRLRNQGLKLREIAAEMGMSISSVSTYLLDPDLSRQRARRERYRGTCQGCGEPTDGSAGFSPPPFCKHCAPSENAKWSRSKIVDAIRRWVALYGEVPVAPEWRRAPSDRETYTHIDWDEIDRRWADGDYPCTGTVQYCFDGQWSAALAAAGFTRLRGHYRDESRRHLPRTEVLA